MGCRAGWGASSGSDAKGRSSDRLFYRGLKIRFDLIWSIPVGVSLLV